MNHAPIYLLRHGQTLWNTERRMQGKLDSPLTQLGHAQARALGMALRDHVGDCTIISSPQPRAVTTASIVAQSIGLALGDIRHDDRLCEMTWGEMDGHTIPEIDVKWPGQVAARQARHWDYVPPGGESYAMVLERLRSFVEEMQRFRQPTVVVSHGAVSRVIRGLYLKLEPPAIVALHEPQHIAFRLHGGVIEEIVAAL